MHDVSKAFAVKLQITLPLRFFKITDLIVTLASMLLAIARRSSALGLQPQQLLQPGAVLKCDDSLSFVCCVLAVEVVIVLRAAACCCLHAAAGVCPSALHHKDDSKLQSPAAAFIQVQ
jgi:hypothetical protein